MTGGLVSKGVVTGEVLEPVELVTDCGGGNALVEVLLGVLVEPEPPDDGAEAGGLIT
jgi:hypothetical protein